jgi:hypothetical protein
MEFSDIMQIVNSNPGIQKHGRNALVLWALGLRYQIDDLDVFASSVLTDGSDDKKCDLIWVNRDEKFALIAQDYFKDDIAKATEAPPNKASDLNTAVAWVFGNDNLSVIPERIRSGVADVRDAIAKKEISEVYFFYIHNLPESVNVRRELDKVKATADKYLSAYEINVFTQEIGQNTIITWYESLQNPILVTDEITISTENGYWTQVDKWKSFTTNIPGTTLSTWFNDYGEKLFSANQRDYLGSRKSDKNINNGIKNSATGEPENFWVFNNGISIITNKIIEDGTVATLSGISIINGAQTTGSLGSVEQELANSLLVLCRFIECNDQVIVKNIVKYNNSQNKLISSDYRSNDRIQRRLVDEINAYKGENLVYTGGRRGGDSDAITRRSNLISSDSVAQALTAFHGRPDIGYKFKSRIWEENEDYKRVFNDNTRMTHILFVHSLHKEILNRHAILKNKSKNNEALTKVDISRLNYFNSRGSTFVLIYAISRSMEVIIGKTVDDLFSLKFSKPSTLSTYQEYWAPIIDIALSFSDQLIKGLQNYSVTMETIDSAVDIFVGLIQAVADPNQERLDQFASKVA